MKNSQLDRLLRFAQRTGDRLIVTDSQGKDPVVILSLDEYEELLDGRPKLTGRKQAPTPPPEEEELDIEAIEAAVTAAMEQELGNEPDIVPVRPLEEETASPNPSLSGGGREENRRTRQNSPAGSPDPNEEQFYLEPI